MVSPHPDLQRRFSNVDNIVKANKSHFVSGLYTKYPSDYVDLEIHSKLDRIKPWIEKSSNKSSNVQKLQPPIIDRILVLCVDFNDRPAQISTTAIYYRFFSDIGKSFKNYYREVSYNQYIPDGEIHGWYRAPHNSTWYTSGNYGLGNIYPFNTAGLVEDVLDIARNDHSINWASFDANGDGYLSSVIIVHSGAEAASTGNTGDFWAHVSSIPFPRTIQGKTISSYALSAEYIAPTFLTQVIGVDCHEFAHLLYLPDLYDYSRNSNGAGNFSLMAGGSWTGNVGDTPTHLDAWSKYFMGWSNTIEDPVGIVNIETVQLNPINYKYTTADPLEYFMVENRQAILFDSYLPAYGILIWHINERQQYNDNELCFKVGLIQADGQRDLENKANSGDGGDSYPGWTNNRSFGPSTIPNSSLCDGTTQDILINNISNPGNIMSFDSYIATIPSGSIEFRVYPLSSADIYFGTTYKGTTDPTTGVLLINNIPIGIINYTIKKTGYYDKTDSVEVIADTTVIVYVILNAIPGTVNMTSTPSGAQIYMDNTDTLKVTPNTITGLQPGSHTYKLTHTGYYDKTGSFLISAGQTLNIDVNLNQMTKGEVNITSNPIGAEIYIDNIDTLQITPATISNLDVGTHTYKLTLTGYQDKTGPFEIAAGYTNYIDAGNLIIIIATGELNITSNPIGAEIYIDNTDTLKVTPNTITDLQPGTHTYKLTLATYQDKIGNFDITIGQTTDVDAGDLQIQVAQAGGSPASMILMAGLVLGSMYSSMKKSA